MGNQSGHVPVVRASLQEQTLRLKPMALCAVRPSAHFIHKNAEPNMMALCASCIGHCRTCPLREQCLAHGKETKHPRRVSAVLKPIEGPSLRARGGPIFSACHSANLVGRLEPLSDTAQAYQFVTHANRYDHCPTSQSLVRGCKRKRPLHARATETLSAQLGTASRS